MTETQDFLVVSGGMEWEFWSEADQSCNTHISFVISDTHSNHCTLQQSSWWFDRFSFTLQKFQIALKNNIAVRKHR